jgi:hypothetical protein
MATFTPNKSNSVVVLAHQAVTHPVTIVGSSIAALTKKAVTIFMFHGFAEAGANTNPGKFKVQIRPDAGDGSVNEHWVTIATFVTSSNTTVSEAFTATEAAGVKVCAVSSTTGFAAEDKVYIRHTTLASSEWAEIQEIVTNTSIDILDGLTAEQTAAASTFFSDATNFICSLNLNANESYRVIWSHEGATGMNGHVKALAITHDSDGSA